MTKQQTDELFNTITSNGCREMNQERFHQAVNEALENITIGQNLFEAIQNTFEIAPLETDMQEIIRAVKKDNTVKSDTNLLTATK